jgi:choline-glycine betaine transporter
MVAVTSWFKNWAPKDHGNEKAEDHMKKMFSVGKLGSKFIYFNPVITALAAGGIWGFAIWAMISQEEAAEDMGIAQEWVTDVWNWLYMISQNVWIVVLLYICYKYYNLKLGKDTDEPEFSDATYFAMLFSCGVATGLWYFTAEGMWHYEGSNAPRWMDSSMFNANTRAEHALMVTFFHWGVHGWIPYTVVGALIAILTYRRGFPMSMRFTLYPLIGEMCYGVLGDLVEVMSILCTVFGVCTSLGLGAMQINKGLVRLDRGTYHGKDTIGCDTDGQITCNGNTGLEENTNTQIAIIVVITLFATGSVVLGLKRGIAALSKIAFGLSLFILLSILFMDNTWYILNALTSAFGYYLWYLPKISFHTDAWEELGLAAEGAGGAPDGRGGKAGWMNAWTIFYWGWWISWGPFVGTFLARISKGRKLGNFIISSLILPSVWSFIFMGIFGAAQIRITNQAMAAGLTGCSSATAPCPELIYGSLANKTLIGYNVPNLDGTGTHWQPVADGTVRLYNLATENVLFEHLQAYGGQDWSTFMSVIVLICIVLYFVTSSDSASFVVDIMAQRHGGATPRPEDLLGVHRGRGCRGVACFRWRRQPQGCSQRREGIAHHSRFALHISPLLDVSGFAHRLPGGERRPKD